MIKNKKEKIIIGVLIVAFVIVCYLITEHKKASQYEYRITRENTVILEKYLGDDEVVKIPSKLYGKKVVKLEQCFEGNSIIQEVDIPATVTTMTGTFKKASNLRKVTGGEGVEYTHYAFLNCVSLETFPNFSNIKYISDGSFQGCTALESINLPEGLESIGGYAFAGAENLKEVVISKSVTAIQDRAFIGTTWYNNMPFNTIVGDKVLMKICTEQEDVYIPEGIKYVTDFMITDNVNNIYIPNTVEKVDSIVFNTQDKVKVYVPKSVETCYFYVYPESNKPTIIVEKDSYAHEYLIEYAEEDGLNYEIVDDVQAIYESTLAESQSK